ncbi:hypothetical protein GJ496_009860 [Pomphorhynchus laevis]|nr:hypothetical protein GJ496_009860 [Pomphorhynchus laevis]
MCKFLSAHLVQSPENKLMDTVKKRAVSKTQSIVDIDEKISKNKLSRFQNFKKFIWNPKTGEVLGRTSLSWAKIALYYSIFYTFLAGFFIVIFAIFITTVSRQLPTFYNKESVMDYKGVNPGMGFRPMDSETNIRIVVGQAADNIRLFDKYKYYANTFLEQNGSTSNLTDCMLNISKPLVMGEVCRYSYSALINDTKNPCHLNNQAGYTAAGNPCVIIKLNRIIGWEPKPGTPTFNSSLNDSFVYFNCSNMDAFSNETFPSTTYYSMGEPNGSPTHGSIPFSYFPYYNYYDYVPPFVVVHFRDLPANQVIDVICKAYAPNIDNDDQRNYRGMTHFQLLHQTD